METTTIQNAEPSRRAWPVLLLALPAFVAIWSGWVELGRLTGFGPVSPLPGIWDEATIDTAITLPIGAETDAAYALQVWLARDVSERARRFARVSAMGSLVLGAAGQVAYHLMAAAGVIRAPWWITALVACLPVAVLGMGAALAHLVAEVPAAPAQKPQVADAETDTVQEGDQLPSWTQNEIEGRAALIRAARQISQEHPEFSHEEVIYLLTRRYPAIVRSAGANVRDVEREIWPEDIAAAVEPDQAPKPEPAAMPAPIRPAPADQARRGTGKPSRNGQSNAEKARKLREKHPDWTVARIAERVGVTERTARRYFSPAPGAQAEPTDMAA